MTREYGSIHTRFWTNFAMQSLSNDAKLLALYLLTGPHTNMLGCFRLPVGYISEDLNWSAQAVVKGLDELLAIDFAQYDSVHQWIFIPQFLNWNAIENPNQGKSIRRLFEQVPQPVHFFAALVRTLLTHDTYWETDFKATLLRCTPAKNPPEPPPDIPDHPSDAIAACPEITPTGDVPIITIPLNDHSEFAIFAPQVNAWQSLYPGIDVPQTLRAIRAWNQANPKRRKTQSGVLRHIVTWLNQAQNQNTTVNHSHRTHPVHENNLRIAQAWLHPPTVPDVDITPQEATA